MKKAQTPIYPDVLDVLALHATERRERAKRSFGEKIAMIEQLRERLAPLKKAREERRAAERQGHEAKLAGK